MSLSHRDRLRPGEEEAQTINIPIHICIYSHDEHEKVINNEK